jgi:hypothetical protein
MNNRALAMPEYVARLIRLPLLRMKLEPSEVEDDIVSCSMLYENGAVLSLVAMCIMASKRDRETCCEALKTRPSGCIVMCSAARAWLSKDGPVRLVR